jgi:protein TonB
MGAKDTARPAPPPDRGSGHGIVSSGWLGSQSIFDRPDERRMGRAFTASMAVHAGVLVAVLALWTVGPTELLTANTPLEYKVIFLPDPGPGGGGGGSPAPAPKRQLEVAQAKVPEPIPVEPPKPAPEPPPTPTLVAPIQTNMAMVMQASGQSSVSLADYGGGGRGGGLGPGTGNGVGEGTGGGFGGGAFQPGNGITSPTLIRDVRPNYTSEAMRAKITGTVELDVVVLENGSVGDVRVARSLDKVFGLDQEAIIAARKWRFNPGVDRAGKPVRTIVRLVLDFRLH